MKNTTLSRKPASEMKKGVGEYKPRRTASQAGDGEDFAFNGQMGDGVNRAGNRYAGNQAGLTMRENYGMAEAARRGNASDSIQERRESTGPSVTHDPLRKTISTAAQSRNPIESGFGMLHYGNPDKINVGSK